MDDYLEPGTDFSEYKRFRVFAGNDNVGIVRARVARSAMMSGSLADINWPRFLTLAVLEETEAGLIAGAMPDGQDVTLDLSYDWDDAEYILNLAGGLKQCEWRRPAESRGSVCTAAKPSDPEPTTQALCQFCELPDSRFVCSGLVHPVVKYSGGVGVYVDGGEGAPSEPGRYIEEAYCEVSVAGGAWSGCVPWQRDCWYRMVETGRTPPRADESSPRRLIDEIPYLRLTYADHFTIRGSEFWPNADERAVAEILHVCLSPEDFHRSVAALDTVITRMDPCPQLSEERRTQDGTKVGSIVGLARVLEDRCGAPNLSVVEQLKALHRVRNSYPAHPRSDDLTAALRTLGIDHYPPHDWRLAWWQVAATVAEAITDIRLAIQTSGRSADV
jgi:hypothetical protein